jgi:alpha-1,3-glucosyltransferase
MQRFKFTIPQRKEKEEGSTHLTKSTDWAYYDDPEDIDKLIVWLDERGHREKQLRKELQIFRDRIAEYMEKMKKHLTKVDKVEDEEEDEESKPRISTRGKANAEKEEAKERCLLWTNSIMFEEYGYIHSTEYEPPKKGKARVVKTTKGKSRR